MLYQNKNNEIFQFTEIDEQNGFIPKEMKKLTEAQLKAYENKPEFGVWNGNGWDIDEVAKSEQQVAEAKQYLADTGWYVERLHDPSSGKAIPEEVVAKRAEARELINTLEAELGGL